ncbi:MAG: dihydropyrimidinase [Anaerolineae bacterium]
MTYDLVIRGGRVITATHELTADVAIDGEKIAAIGRGLHGRRTLDADGLLVLPGAVDGHVHLNLRTAYGRTADDFYQGTVAAAFGGVTSIVDFVDPRPDQPLPEALAERRGEADGRAVIDYGLHMTLTGPMIATRPAWRDEAPLVRRAGCYSFKLYTAYPGYYLPDDALLQALEAVAAVDGLAVVHAENWPVIQTLTRRFVDAGQVEPRWHPHSRPAITEGEAVQRVLALARLTGARALIFHISCAEASHALALARAQGQVAYGETCPHYLVLDDSAYLRPLPEALRFLCQPPIRGLDEQQALWRAVAGGDLDVISTDHCPHPDEQKQAGATDFTRTAGGISGIETRLALMHTFGVRRGLLSRSRWVELCCTAPARIFGLPGKGEILPGADADIVLFDPTRPVTLSAAGLHSAIPYSQYEGVQVTGYPVTTLSRGEVIIADGQFSGRPGRGRFCVR